MVAQEAFSTRLDRIHRYADGANELRQAWDETPEEARRWRPAPHAWSALEILAHCADSETSASSRIRTLAVEPLVQIMGYDQDEWASVLRYHDTDPELALATITAVRAWTVPTLLRLSDTQWEAVGQHSESGAYSAEMWLANYSAHLHDHAEQIRSNVRDWQARASQES